MKQPILSLSLGLAAALPATAQSGHDVLFDMSRASHVVVPQSRSFQLGSAAHPIVLETVRAEVHILEQTARTRLEVVMRNPGPTQAEAVLVLPVPDGAAVAGFEFEGNNPEPTAQLLAREEARRMYDDIVARLRDPALLEFAGHNLVRSSVFPLQPGSTQRILLTYEHLLQGHGNRVDYVLPRSASLEQSTPWEISVDVRSSQPVSTVYSPSHAIDTTRLARGRVRAKLTRASAREPGAFLLSVLREQGTGVAASLFSYPDPSIGGGYFLLLAGLPTRTDADRAGLRREVTLVLDRSGSMAGAKMDQAIAAAGQILEGLEDGEGFQIVDYSTTVASFAATPVRKTRQTTIEARQYLAGLRPGGGTNIHDALVEALRPAPLEGTLPIVLFLTDGLPTVGRTTEQAIRAAVHEGNPHARRVFTFGVGHDVNVPLLDWVADSTRATTTYVQPGEDVEVAVGDVFDKLYGPVLAAADLRTLDAAACEDTRRIREVHPPRLPDLFENDQLVVLGQYRGDEPLRFELNGNYRGQEKTFRFEFDLDATSTRNAFVPRLWASRRIAYLIDQVRQHGAGSATPQLASADPFGDPRMRELREEILRLSTEFGVLSEYTAFLATEGTRLSDWHSMLVTCGTELDTKAVRTRSGIAAVNQGANILQLKEQSVLNTRNSYYDAQMNRVEVASVQQIHDRAFFRRGNRWVDGRAILSGELEADRTIMFGSDEHLQLLRELVEQKRSGILSLSGEILIRFGTENVLVVNGGC